MIPGALWDAARDLQEFLASESLAFCFIGGIACQRWGEPRMTRDLDGTVIADFGQEMPVVRAVLRRYQPRIADPVSFALQARVLLVQDISGFGIDLSLGGMPYEHRLVARASAWGSPGAGTIRTCSAEDLVVLKAFASRPQDWIDIQHVIRRQAGSLDRELVIRELQPLVELKEEPEILDHLRHLFEQAPS